MRRRELESGSGQRPTGLPPHLKNVRVIRNPTSIKKPVNHFPQNTTNVPIENGHHAHRDMNGTWCSEDKPKAQNQQEVSPAAKTTPIFHQF